MDKNIPVSNRTQFVEVNNAKSASGVPQYWVQFFVLHVADTILPILTVRLFADNLLIYSDVNCYQDKFALNSVLQVVTA